MKHITQLHAKRPLLLLAAMVTCGTAMADPSSITIKLDGIDLTRPEGVSTVHERIRLAASKVCLNILFNYGPSASTAYSDCVDRATEAAVRMIDRKMRPTS